MSDEVTDYRKLAEALADALEKRNLWIEGEEYRELVILRMRLSNKVDSLSEELKVATARIAELEAAQQKAIVLLPELERGHYYCDDCWYSCPKAVDGCCDERQGDECNCGADKYNQLLSEIISLLTPPEVQE